MENVMNAKGINLSYYMMGGEVRGCIKCSRKVWSAVAYRIPRNVAADCKKIEDLTHSGVYLLLGEDDNGKSTVYVGQGADRKAGSGVLQRMLESHGKAVDWTIGIALTSKNNELGPTELCYLENQLYKKAVAANRASVLNNNEPSSGKPSDEEISDMSTYLDQAEVLVKALGCEVLTPIDLKSDEKKEPLLYFKIHDCLATGRYLRDGFVLYHNSQLRPNLLKSCPECTRRDRDRYADKIVDNVLQADLLFNSPSAAACFVCGSSMNGWVQWKTDQGMTLREYEQSR